MKRYYLAYGSNLNVNQMKNKCFNPKIVGTTLLENHRLLYKGTDDNSAYLTIEEQEGYSVPLSVYEVSIFDMISLSKNEGEAGFYTKKELPITIQKGEKQTNVGAFTYVMNKEVECHIPSKEYVRTCLEGYEDFGFDKTILHRALLDTIENRSKIKTIGNQPKA